MVSPQPRPLESAHAAADLAAPLALPLPWSGRIWRGKLRRPLAPPDTLSRPRLLRQIDEGERPLTLVVAPAGFGKTTVAAEWASQTPSTAWLTADAADASLLRFWAHLCRALASAAPDFGELVSAAMEIPHRVSANDLGRMLADELHDARAPIRLVIDDLHLVPAGEVTEFLAGLLEMAPPGFRLLAAARSEPPLPLTRMRLRGMLKDVRGADLLFTRDETRFLVTGFAPGAPTDARERLADDLWQRAQGWPAGLRLAAIAAERDVLSGLQIEPRGIADRRLLTALVDETLAGRSPQERAAMVRAALLDRFNEQSVAALLDVAEPVAITREAIRFALAGDLCRPSTRSGGDWLEFHPLFLDALRRQLAADEPPHAVAALHRRAAAWHETEGLIDVAIVQWLAAGEDAPAVALVEREMQPAFNREDWPAVARWLALLPEALVQERPRLLLGRGALAHLRGQASALRELPDLLERRLSKDDVTPDDAAAYSAELAMLRLGNLIPMQLDPERARVIAERSLDTLPAGKRFQRGLAATFVGMALQSTGHGGDAAKYLEKRVNLGATPIDAGTIRALFGALFVHWQAGELSRLESQARAARELAGQNGLRLAAGWGCFFLGNALYERNDVDGAIAAYGPVARDYEYFHLTGLREVMFGLALAYLADGRPEDAWRALRRCRDILAEAGVFEHFPVVEAYEAYVALGSGNGDRALAWAHANPIGIDDATFYVMIHPSLIRATILAVGDEASRDEAATLLAELRERARRAHFAGPLVRIEALAAVVEWRRGMPNAAREALRRSLTLGSSRGFTRAYLDLLPPFAAELQALASEVEFPPAVAAALRDSRPDAASRPIGPIERLTAREVDVLTALTERLSYKEIAEQLFISPLTVKRHASSIYSKLGVAGRRDAIRAAQELGWRP